MALRAPNCWAGFFRQAVVDSELPPEDREGRVSQRATSTAGSGEQQPSVVQGEHGGTPGGDAELAVDGAHMALDGVDRYVERRRDLAQVAGRGQLDEHVAFPPAQPQCGCL